jgi:hypothetical protein
VLATHCDDPPSVRRSEFGIRSAECQVLDSESLTAVR